MHITILLSIPFLLLFSNPQPAVSAVSTRDVSLKIP